MAHPIYRTKDGTRVPSVTTIISRCKESGGLIHWAWDLGKQDIDYRDVRNKAADAGTIAHGLVEHHVLGSTYAMPPEATDEIIELGQIGFGAFLEWYESTDIEVTHTETSLVSEEYRYGGTPDALGLAGGKRSLLDWKTSNRLYHDYLYQLAGYKQLVEEHDLLGGPIERFHIVRFGKQYGDFQHRMYMPKQIESAWEGFKHVREFYGIDKEVKRSFG